MSNVFDHLKDRDSAKVFLAGHLKDGSMVLFLGSGVSSGLGLPSWTELINFLRQRAGQPTFAVKPSSDELQTAADAVIRKVGETKVMDLIEEYFYTISKTKSNISDTLKNTLLVSISALLMGSKRGHISKVVTLNYDNMLEWFLSLFGFVVKTIHTLPDLEGSEDIRVYHPHGFIPNPVSGKSRSNFLILGVTSADRRLGNRNDLWSNKISDVLNAGVCLFLGMSRNTLRDRALSPLFQSSHDHLNGQRPLGFWTMHEDEMKDPDAEGQFDGLSIIPLSFSSYEDIPEFLFEICQEASQNTF